MDPTLLAYLQSAIKGNKGVGGTLGTIDSPLWGIISGGFNPNTLADFGRTNSTLLSQHANTEDPVVQAVLEQIYSGADPYALSSWLAKYEASNPAAIQQSGWQSQDLGNLATALQKEYASGGEAAKQDYWQKMGLSNPLDIYSEATTPMGKKSANRVRQLDAELARLEPGTVNTQGDVMRAFANLKNAKTATGDSAIQQFYSGKELAKMIKRQGTDFNPIFGRISGDAKNFTKWLEKQDQISVEDALSQAESMGVKQTGAYPSSMRVVKEGLGRKDRLERIAPKNTSIVEGTPEFYAFREAIDASRRQMGKVQDIEAKKKATQRGALRAVMEQGRTPLSDELKQRMAMLGQLAK